MDLEEINAALCRALGFGDAENITGLILQLSPDKVPVVTVQRLVLTDFTAASAGIETVRAVYQLEPKEPRA